MLKFLVVLLAISCLSSAFAEKKHVPKVYGTIGSTEKRIYDGTPAVSGQFKFMVGLFIQEPEAGFLCGGFILNEHYVGTAAHCVDQYKNTSLIIYTVEDDLNLNEAPAAGDVIKAHVQAIHPLWNGDNLGAGYDIALLRTLSPIPLGGNIQTITLADDVPEDGDTLYLAGYGLQPNGTTGVLLYGDQPYITPDDCDDAWNATFNSDLLLCAGGEAGRGSCQGDSGSALFTTSDITNPTDAKAVGIVSFGSSAGCGTLPVVYTNIPKFGKAWFNYAMGVASYCSSDCVKAFRKCNAAYGAGARRKCRKAKQTCLASCILV